MGPTCGVQKVTRLPWVLALDNGQIRRIPATKVCSQVEVDICVVKKSGNGRSPRRHQWFSHDHWNISHCHLWSMEATGYTKKIPSFRCVLRRWSDAASWPDGKLPVAMVGTPSSESLSMWLWVKIGYHHTKICRSVRQTCFFWGSTSHKLTYRSYSHVASNFSGSEVTLPWRSKLRTMWYYPPQTTCCWTLWLQSCADSKVISGLNDADPSESVVQKRWWIPLFMAFMATWMV